LNPVTSTKVPLHDCYRIRGDRRLRPCGRDIAICGPGFRPTAPFEVSVIARLVTHEQVSTAPSKAVTRPYGQRPAGRSLAGWHFIFGSIGPATRSEGERPLSGLAPGKQTVRFRPRSAVPLGAHPRRSRCLMLRPKQDFRSGSGLRMVETLLEFRKLFRRWKIVTQKPDLEWQAGRNSCGSKFLVGARLA
jgi:hypothetical protein